MSHLIRDLQANGDVQYRNSMTGKNSGNFYDFIPSWCALQDNPGTDINNRLHTPFTAWGVKATDNGLLNCGFEIPESLQRPTVFLSPVGNGDTLSLDERKERALFHSILSPAGSITDIHDDGVLWGSLLVQLYGTKVIFSWPGTDANRKYFERAHGTQHHLRLSEAVLKMPDGFKLTILNPGVAVVMDPGMIHAVVSPTNSAIGSWEYVDARWLQDDHIREGTEWLLALVKSRKTRLPVDMNPEHDLDGLMYGLNMWKCLLVNLRETKQPGMEEHLAKIENLVDWLENQNPMGNIEKDERSDVDCRPVAAGRSMAARGSRSRTTMRPRKRRRA